MSEINNILKQKDASIHKDGIYDIDKSCHIKTASNNIDDNIVFVALTLFVLYKF